MTKYLHGLIRLSSAKEMWWINWKLDVWIYPFRYGTREAAELHLFSQYYVLLPKQEFLNLESTNTSWESLFSQFHLVLGLHLADTVTQSSLYTTVKTVNSHHLSKNVILLLCVSLHITPDDVGGLRKTDFHFFWIFHQQKTIPECCQTLKCSHLWSLMTSRRVRISLKHFSL